MRRGHQNGSIGTALDNDLRALSQASAKHLTEAGLCVSNRPVSHGHAPD